MIKYEDPSGITRWLVFGTYIKETEKAYFVEISGESHWLPKSVVLICDGEGIERDWDIPEWLCDKNGIEVTGG